MALQVNFYLINDFLKIIETIIGIAGAIDGNYYGLIAIVLIADIIYLRHLYTTEKNPNKNGGHMLLNNNVNY